MLIKGILLGTTLLVGGLLLAPAASTVARADDSQRTCTWGVDILIREWKAKNPDSDRDDAMKAMTDEYIKKLGPATVGSWSNPGPEGGDLGLSCDAVHDIYAAEHPEWDGNMCILQNGCHT